MKDSKIEWTDHTFNPWWGCTKVSPGCAHCYAETLDKRVGGHHWGTGVERRAFGDKHWRQPIIWNNHALVAGRRARVFCASMADVFDAEAPEGQLDRLWALIRETPNLDWQLLTKRPERIAQSLPRGWGEGWPNVWLGTSVEDQKRADERIPRLSEVPARVRFLSIEPIVGPIELSNEFHWAGSPFNFIHWVIVGGESGHGARPMHPDWARNLRDETKRAGRAFFFKQWGEWADPKQTIFSADARFNANDGVAWLNPNGSRGSGSTHHEGAAMVFRIGKHETGRAIDDREWNEMPASVGAC